MTHVMREITLFTQSFILGKTVWTAKKKEIDQERKHVDTIDILCVSVIFRYFRPGNGLKVKSEGEMPLKIIYEWAWGTGQNRKWNRLGLNGEVIFCFLDRNLSIEMGLSEGKCSYRIWLQKANSFKHLTGPGKCAKTADLRTHCCVVLISCGKRTA